jgi:hypothetical protein
MGGIGEEEKLAFGRLRCERGERNNPIQHDELLKLASSLDGRSYTAASNGGVQ